MHERTPASDRHATKNCGKGTCAIRSLSILRLMLLLLLPHQAAGGIPAEGWSHVTNLPTPRAQTVAVTDPASGRIFVAGGYSNGPFIATAMNTFEIYDPATNGWTSGPTMPFATRGATAAHSAGKIYVFGGTVSHVQIFDIVSNSWSTAAQSFDGFRSSAVTLPDGNIQVTGGERDGYHSPFNSVNRRFNTTTHQTSLAASLFQARRGHEGALIDGKVLAFGGNEHDQAGAMAAVDAYDPLTDSWSTAPADMPIGRLQFASGVSGTHFFAAGGSSTWINGTGPWFDSFHVFDAAANTWMTGPALPEGLRELSGAVSGSRFFVFGGIDAAAISAEVYSVVVPEPGGIALLGLAMATLLRRTHARRGRVRTGY